MGAVPGTALPTARARRRPGDGRRAGRRPHLRGRLPVVVGALVLPATALAWLVVARAELVPSILLPELPEVLTSLRDLFADGVVRPHLTRTVSSVLLGFTIGSLAGMLVGALLTMGGRVTQQTYSVMIASLEAVPIVVIAPILNTFLGFGMASKVATASVSAFFPVFLTTFAGLGMVARDELRLLESLQASRTQVMLKLRFPAAVPAIFGGFKIAIAFSVVATVIAEFIGTDRGLGYLMLRFRGAYDTSSMWAIILIFAALGAVAFVVLEVAERKLVFWKR